MVVETTPCFASWLEELFCFLHVSKRNERADYLHIKKRYASGLNSVLLFITDDALTCSRKQLDDCGMQILGGHKAEVAFAV